MIQKTFLYIKEFKDGYLEFEDGKFRGVKATILEFGEPDESLQAIERLKEQSKDVKLWLKP